MNQREKRTSKAELTDNWCWKFASDEDKRYHDTEWGVPINDDNRMFEHLSLECLQCGLSWDYVLQRRELFCQAFGGFDINTVAAMTETDLQRVLEIPGMLRSPRKLNALVNNARCAQKLREEFGSLSKYFWSWTNGLTLFYRGVCFLTES